VRSVFVNTGRMFVGLVVLLFFALPFGLSVSGCSSKSAPVQFCSTGDSGPIVGQVASITLSPSLATIGESLNYGQIGQALSASATDCKGNAVSVRSFTYASTSSFSANTNGVIFADINPSNGQVCGGTWNRNTGGGIADYTTCVPPTTTPSGFLAYVTATANGAVSNAIPVYVHPTVTGVVLGPATLGAQNGSCPAGTIDPGTDCCPNDTVGVPVVAPTGVYTANRCLSQNQIGQFVARVYDGTGTSPANNITCQVGHVSFAAQSPAIVSIDQNGAATAQQPGSTVITATISNSSTATNAGFFSTCPPASIALTIPGQSTTTNAINVAINNLQPLTATVVDTQGNPITGLSLEFNSTTPQTIPAAIGSVTPLYPGSADITAVCQPTTCNTAPFSQIGLFGNGKAITSNPITITAVGNSSTVLYMASTSSQYVAFRDFTTNQPSALIKLPYEPNSMVMNQGGTALYFGSSQGLMTVNANTNSYGNTVQTIQGNVLSVSPDGSTLVVTDPNRQTISLVSTSNDAVTTSYGGIGTSASWSPDDQQVYITTTTGAVLTHSPFTDWQTTTSGEVYTNVAVTVPSIGAYFAGPSTTDARSYCPSSTVAGTGNPPIVSNEFLPLADQKAIPTDQIAATTDGSHILGAHAAASGAATLSDINVALHSLTACPTVIPINYFPSTVTTQTLTGINAAAITGVVPASNSKVAFVTYTGPAATAPAGTLASGLLPIYFPPATGSGTLQFLTLGNGATTASAPLAGVFSTDNFTFYVGTSGDNQVHLISLTYGAQPVATEAVGSVLTPNLPLFNGTGNAPVNLIAQHPKKSTN
jgi:hypothetical protein